MAAFALEEVVRLLVDRGDLVHTAGRWVRHDLGELGVPAGFAAIIHQRVQVLTAAGLHVLQAAATTSRPITIRP